MCSSLNYDCWPFESSSFKCNNLWLVGNVNGNTQEAKC